MQSGSVFGDQDRDLLGDTDPEISQKLTAETAELANLSNQIGSLGTATRDLQANKARAETDLASITQQKRDFEARLKQIRTLYDAEVINVRAVEEQLSKVRGELGKNRHEVTVLEASLSALQTQLAEQKGALQKDQMENSSLKTRIAGVGEEMKGLKENLEKVKREARQQRGMVAINKKQLSTMEGEREKIQGEIGTEQKDLEKMREEAAAAAAAPVAREMMSPVGSERSGGTNPFLRMQSTGDSAGAFSPPATNYFPPGQPVTSPPAQSFGAFHEGIFATAFQGAFPGHPAPEPTTRSPEPIVPIAEPALEQRAPPSIASALSPPLAARDSSEYAESATSSIVVQAPRSGVASTNGDGPASSPAITPKDEEPTMAGVVSTSPEITTPQPRDGPVTTAVQETEVKERDEERDASTFPAAVQHDAVPAHGPHATSPVMSPKIVQETLSHRPHDEDLVISSPPPAAAPEEAPPKLEEEDVKPPLPGAFPSESSDEGRESWVDLGDESKSLPSEHPPQTTSTSDLPANRSDPFAFSTSAPSAPVRQATKEDFDAAFSSFGLGNKDPEPFGSRDFNSEFPPIEEYGGEDSESDEETGFNDNFAEKPAPNGRARALPRAQDIPTIVAPVGADAPPPVPPKDALSVPTATVPRVTPTGTPPGDDLGDPPSYSGGYANFAETSSGSNDLSGLLPRRGEPHSSAAPYTSPPPREGFSTPQPPPEGFSTPQPFPAVQPVSFSPPLPAATTPAVTNGVSTPTTVPLVSELPKETPALQPPQFTFPSPKTEPEPPPYSEASSSAQPPAVPPKSPPPQSFAAFDFTGLQEAAPLDESQDDPFRLSTRSDFGEFDTTFDSTPVTPAKPLATSTQATPAVNTAGATQAPANNFNEFNWDAEFDSLSRTGGQPASQAPAGTSTGASNFDDVFASFDKPLDLSPPTLPPRKSSADDIPDLKTLTGSPHLLTSVDCRNGVFEGEGC